MLLVRAEVARDVLPAGLRAAGWKVEVVPAYRTVAATVPDEVTLAAAKEQELALALVREIRDAL